MKIHAYIRRSKDSSDEETQRRQIRVAALERFGREPDTEVAELISGKYKTDDRQLGDLLKAVHFGDVLICVDTTRIGRNFYDSLKTTEYLQNTGASFWALQQNLFVKPDDETINKFLLSAYAFFGENERKAISTRTKAGLESAKLRGVKLGRAFGSFLEPTDKQLKELKLQLSRGEFQRVRITKILGMALPTLARWLKKNPEIAAQVEANRPKNKDKAVGGAAQQVLPIK
jgi:DNA invertase Pin-like site-specific DNA recombinase